MNAPVLMWALDIASVAVALAMVLCAWRLWLGPETTDRILALDTLYINMVVLVVLLGLRWNTSLLFEVSLLASILGFVGTLGWSWYVPRVVFVALWRQR